MTPETVLNITDHAAQASDRWLFLATLIIFLGVVGIAVKWLVSYFTKAIDSLVTDLNKVRDEYFSYLKTTGNETLKTLVATQEILKDCATALTESARLSERKLEVIQRLESKNRTP